MAKKTSKTSLPKWVKSKWFLLGLAVVVAGLVIIGFQSFAALPSYGTSYSTCTTKVIREGSTAKDCVKYAQDRLNYYCKTSYWPWSYSVDLTVDGIFGSGTKAKVMGFQKITGLYPDGIIGSNTWTMLTKMYTSGKANAGLCRF